MASRIFFTVLFSILVVAPSHCEVILDKVGISLPELGSATIQCEKLEIYYPCWINLGVLDGGTTRIPQRFRMVFKATVDPLSGTIEWDMVEKYPVIAVDGFTFDVHDPPLDLDTIDTSDAKFIGTEPGNEKNEVLVRCDGEQILVFPNIRGGTRPLISSYLQVEGDGGSSIVRVLPDGATVFPFEELFGNLPSNSQSTTSPWRLRMLTPSNGSLYAQISYFDFPESGSITDAITRDRKLVKLTEGNLKIDTIFGIGEVLTGFIADNTLIGVQRKANLVQQFFISDSGLLLDRTLDFSYVKDVELSGAGPLILNDKLILFSKQRVYVVDRDSGSIEHQVKVEDAMREFVFEEWETEPFWADPEYGKCCTEAELEYWRKRVKELGLD